MSFSISTPVTAGFGGTSLTLTGVPAGASIVVLLQTLTATTTAVTDGTAYIAAGASSSANFQTQWVQNNAAAGTHTITWTSTGTLNYGLAFYVTGGAVLTGTPACGVSSFVGTGANAVVCPSITTAVAGALVIGMATSDSTSKALTVGTGYTSIGALAVGDAAEYQVQVGAGLVAPTFTSAGSDDYLTSTIAFAPATVGVPVYYYSA